jgi:acyl-CoA dehydrogenase
MTSESNLLSETAARLFKDMAGSRARAFRELWPAIEEMGFLLLLPPESAGGLGGIMSHAFSVLRAAGHYALPLPLAEAMIGHLICSHAGLAELSGLTTVAWRHEGAIDGDRFTGRLCAVPWGRDAETVVVSHGGGNFILRATAASAVTRAENTAGEPRDTLTFERASVTPATGPSVLLLGALLRTAQIVGALHATLALSITYANDRVQFGRSIGKFQVIQHSLAVFAGEAAAATAAGEAAARAADLGDADFEIAAAKCRANKAAAVGHTAAHAVHGAIGFTMEYPLNHLTRRLLSWRSEFGGQKYWNTWLGQRALDMDSGGFWENLTARSDELGLRSGESK